MKPHLKNHVKKAENAARRLVVTEQQRVAGQAQMKIYQDSGIRFYRFISEPKCCKICAGLEGKIFKVSQGQAGINLRPMHPYCRCSTAMANDPADADFNEWLSLYDSPMGLKNIPTWSAWKSGLSYKMSVRPGVYEGSIWPKAGYKLTKEQIDDLESFAAAKDVKLIGASHFDGDIKLVFEAIESVDLVRQKFPLLNTLKRPIEIGFNYPENILDNPQDDDLAEVNKFRISLNGYAFRNKQILAAEYESKVQAGWFVEGTTYRNIIFHEMGHIVSEAYHISPRKVINGVVGKTDFSLIRDRISAEISEYGATNYDEAFAESISAYMTGNDTALSLRIIESFFNIVSERGIQ